MKKYLVISLLAIVAICSCQKQELGDQVYDSKTFTATIDDDNDTKTSLNENSILWKKGDQVSIFAGCISNDKYQVTDASDGKKNAQLTPISTKESSSKLLNNVAYYPYTSTVCIGQESNHYEVRQINIPSVQNYADNGFGNGAFPMVAVTNSASDYNLKFKNILGGLKIQLKGTATIKSISVKGNNNEILYGTGTVTASKGNVPSISLTDETARVVILDCGEGVSLNNETATPFVISLPPINLTNGFTVTVTDSEYRQMEIKTTKSKSITRSNILKMSELTYNPEDIPDYVDLGLSVKWATCNLGATKPEEGGKFFKFGDVTGQTIDSTYVRYGGTCVTWSGDGFGNSKVPFELDDNNNLKPEYDAAHVILGGTWRMPTYNDIYELVCYCNLKWIQINGVNGMLFTSRKPGYTDKSIFLPAAGWGYDKDHCLYINDNCRYWTSTNSTQFNPGYEAMWLLLTGQGINFNTSASYKWGHSIRPVTE